MRSTGLLYKFLPTNLGVCKPTFYTFYTSHLRWNSTFYHTDLGQNTAFHNFSMSRTINRGLLAKPFKKFQKSPIRPAGSHFYSASCQCGRVFEWNLIELSLNIIANLLLLLFCYLMVLVITMCNLIKRLIRATFLSTPASDCSSTIKTNGTDKRLKLQERLLTVNKRNMIRWNMYRDNNFHSRRRVFKCL